MPKGYIRPYSRALSARLKGPRLFIQAVTGARQVGKTTLVRQVVSDSGLPAHFASADEPTLQSRDWIAQQWQTARQVSRKKPESGAVLVLDEIQKITGWSGAVKRLWDEDTAARTPLRVVILGSAPLLVSRGLTESLAGRFETLHLPHWSFVEMNAAFGWPLEKYLFYGGYPGSAPLVTDHQRWSRYIIDSLIETTISRDVLLLSRVDKPALLRRLFELGCRYSGQILSYTKMLGQLHEAGNTTTLAHYLDLLGGAGMLTGLHKFAGEAVRRRASSPKFQVLNTALMSAQSGLGFDEARADHEFWGRLTESAVGAHLMGLATSGAAGAMEIYYWREGDAEVDFVVRSGRKLITLEVKSGRSRGVGRSAGKFGLLFKPHRSLLVGEGGIPIEDFLTMQAAEWIQG